MIKTRGDLGRLGGLFKAALADPERIFERLQPDTWMIKREFRNLLQEIDKRQEEFRRLVAKI